MGYKGNEALNGSFTRVEIAGTLVGTAQKGSAKIKYETETWSDGDEDVDKQVGKSGEMELEAIKVGSKFFILFLPKTQGKEVYVDVYMETKDPDVKGVEAYLIKDCWLKDEISIVDFERKKVLRETLKFGFKPSNMQPTELVRN